MPPGGHLPGPDAGKEPAAQPANGTIFTVTGRCCTNGTTTTIEDLPPPNPNNQCITGTTNVTNVTIVTTDENRPKLSAEESLPDPSSGSVQQRHWRVMLDQIAEDDLEGLEVILETFVGFASTSQGETASNVPQNGPHRSRNIPGRQRHPRPSRPKYDPIEAARVQKLYRTNIRKAMNQLLKGKSPPCPLDGGTIINHLRSPAGGAPMEDAHLS